MVVSALEIMPVLALAAMIVFIPALSDGPGPQPERIRRRRK